MSCPPERFEPHPLRLKRGSVTAPLAGSGVEPLLAPLPETVRTALEALPEALQKVMPLSGAHRRSLPDAVRELSAMLTTERGSLDLPYWSAPRLASAYLRYFLPWNLLRLGHLLPALNLPIPPAGALIADLGSGPLTFPLALWLALPSWRSVPLEVLAVDSSGQALELGKKLFQTLAPESPWRIRLLRAPLHKALGIVRGKPFLITAANVLNELANHKDRHGEIMPMAERMGALAARLGEMVDPQGAVLCVEPGNRLGGTVLEHVRAGALESGLVPRSPCPHQGECPLLERKGPGSGWCHVIMESGDAPHWLRQVAQAAGLGKSSLSISHLVFRSQGSVDAPQGEAAGREALQARVLSDAFAVPGLGLARYVCTREGLALLRNSGTIPQGSLLTLRPCRPPQRDAKSGIPVLERVSPAAK